jgi:hypothetical protein
MDAPDGRVLGQEWSVALVWYLADLEIWSACHHG